VQGGGDALVKERKFNGLRHARRGHLAQRRQHVEYQREQSRRTSPKIDSR